MEKREMSSPRRTTWPPPPSYTPKGELLLPAHCYPARHGLTTFLLHLPIPHTSLSMTNFSSGLARVRYKVPDEPFNCADPKGVVVGKPGEILIQGSIVGASPHSLVHNVALPPCLTSLSSTPHRAHLSMTLTRHPHLPNAWGPPHALLQIMDTLATVYFRGPEYIWHPGMGGVALLMLEVLWAMFAFVLQGQRKSSHPTGNMLGVRMGAANGLKGLNSGGK
ncbi:hypothetical protein HETIRDRAFT_455007 [Heterobasidion irregulare TC 32-1]|uniref:Uncharacterized protein n=1 Tax=Heterobasidion irregulare (strain TC 32-1) TaxID=747525 RepID=W4JS89_HETIT|nr:uncharacterized protein HETIRDRAFT_455007 [Heterobasidion irregulare TC 32-1]ETW76427.1 hypothetical protein HETIRDRAFT_455007 [Heterobasidion irregulare TC 32-1]